MTVLVEDNSEIATATVHVIIQKLCAVHLTGKSGSENNSLYEWSPRELFVCPVEPDAYTAYLPFTRNGTPLPYTFVYIKKAVKTTSTILLPNLQGL